MSFGCGLLHSFSISCEPFSKRTNVYGVLSHLEGRKGLAKDYNIYNGDGDLDRTTIAVGLVHKF